MIVKPKAGVRVLPPGRGAKRPLPPEGIEVSDTDPYWIRREQQGDVVTVKTTPAKE
jgi:hypothetical protein